jgi:multidrug efflux system outer membrane protein
VAVAAALTNKNIEEVIMLNSALKRLTLAVPSPWQSPAAPPSAPISRRRPTSPMPSFRHLPQAGASEAHLPAQWWTVFNDATLNRLEEPRCATIRA